MSAETRRRPGGHPASRQHSDDVTNVKTHCTYLGAAGITDASSILHDLGASAADALGVTVPLSCVPREALCPIACSPASCWCCRDREVSS